MLDVMTLDELCEIMSVYDDKARAMEEIRRG